ncbi:preprotein translocase subunit SecA [Halioglobus japonicus]|uniref:Protein translocase subunit SecA n=1 Tax=Halioglobus japonicus TaxID=930805 RepID=A0AAP8MGB1_9GAMM|nr:preprotein translocase subunit SecA [Halioglobus japonicus]AQA19769.1 preprotein translocase subunit SecA [Halioglobus japonicus]PLW87159.1 preprotein translocase subunit SecA [Halioglobus japonicus]GHD09917.1 protein translocase subunit SecA [Halioglobus japonicus]
MIGNPLKMIFGTRNDRELKRLGKVVKKINALAEDTAALSDEQLKAKTEEFKGRLANGDTLDKILPEAFAVVREAGERVLGLRHFDVQLIGGMALHEGKIAEMRTGEGKTLVATLPAYLNALAGSVHLITVNDYLATRDAAWMGPLYEFLGVSVGVIRSGQLPEQKTAAYSADIIYGTNNEFGFDYLRDNMAFTLGDKMQGNLAFAIVDEVDSILIDEARTPLVISGASEDSSELYKRINKLIPSLQADVEGQSGHFTVDEKARQVELTEDGHEFIEGLLIREGLLQEGDSLYAATNLNLLHHVYSGLRAHAMFQKDVEYIVQEGQVVLIDEHTGRTMPGRRLSEGLHQAIEAKEGVAIQSESQTLASTTFQNYFRLYDKLAGMTGTADTEAFEFRQIYGLEVLVIPTNKKQERKDLNDVVYLSREEKFDAIVADVKDCMEAGAPVLVGTASVETSEELSARFRKSKIQHKVLNAKYHEQEAEIIAQAGRPGVVTIATNMAGRGTDIVLGGNLEAEMTAAGEISDVRKAELKQAWEQRHQQVLEAGGLHILGTERHESRRIDNQLRGRAGRQGDPGVSRFYLSLEDNLMRIFASDRVKNFMQALGMEKGEAIEHRMVTNAIEKAQRKVEGRNFDIRKQLLEYDDVANDQRQIIYEQRNDLLGEADISDTITAIRADVVNEAVDSFIPQMSVEEQWDIPALEKQLEAEFALPLPVQSWLDADDKLHEEALRERIVNEVQAAYEAKCESVGPDMRKIEKQIMLQVLDTLWKEHLATMDHLRQGIHLRAYAQKNPKQEYKRESFALFEDLLSNLKLEVVKFLSHVQIQRQDEAELIERQRREAAEREKLAFQHAEASAMGESEAEEPQAPQQPSTFTREAPKVGRNDPCPCGSGKKYKQCCGKL